MEEQTLNNEHQKSLSNLETNNLAKTNSDQISPTDHSNTHLHPLKSLDNPVKFPAQDAILIKDSLEETPEKIQETEEHFEDQLSKLVENCNEIEGKMQEIEQSLDSPNPEITEPVRNIESRLKQSETNKNKVELLLQQIKTSIEGIQSLEIYSKSHRRPNFRPKDQPVEKFEEQKKKNDLKTERLKEFREDQKKREIVLKKELEKIDLKINEEKQLLKAENARQQEVKKDEYKQELEKMREKKEKRKQELEEIKKRQHDLEAVKNNKPMYKKIEEDYQRVLKQEEDLYKTELEKNKKVHAQVGVIDIAEHTKWYQNVKKEHHQKQKGKIEKFRSVSSGLSSAWTARVLEEDQKLKRDLNRASQERLGMIEKKVKYAEFVKEMFLPTVDRIKRQEKGLSVSPNRGKMLLSPIRENKVADHEIRQSKRKWKENPMVPKPAQKKPPVLVDYLNDRRLARQEEEFEEANLDWERELEGLSAEEQIKFLRKKARVLEKKAKKQELLTNPNDVEAVKNNERVNEMLLGSIKVKLAALEKGS